MNDTISRAAAIDYCYALINAENPSDPSDEWNYSQERINQTEVILHHLEFMPSAQPEQQWIPCSERLPEKGERVLATHLGGLNPDRQVIEHIYQNGGFTCGWEMDTDFHSPTFGQRYMGKVIAWMPLPEPYREERTEE